MNKIIILFILWNITVQINMKNIGLNYEKKLLEKLNLYLNLKKLKINKWKNNKSFLNQYFNKIINFNKDYNKINSKADYVFSIYNNIFTATINNNNLDLTNEALQINITINLKDKIKNIKIFKIQTNIVMIGNFYNGNIFRINLSFKNKLSYQIFDNFNFNIKNYRSCKIINIIQIVCLNKELIFFNIEKNIIKKVPVNIDISKLIRIYYINNFYFFTDKNNNQIFKYDEYSYNIFNLKNFKDNMKYSEFITFEGINYLLRFNSRYIIIFRTNKTFCFFIYKIDILKDLRLKNSQIKINNNLIIIYNTIQFKILRINELVGQLKNIDSINFKLKSNYFYNQDIQDIVIETNHLLVKINNYNNLINYNTVLKYTLEPEKSYMYTTIIYIIGNIIIAFMVTLWFKKILI